MQGNILGQSNNGSSFINGIIEEYKVASGENISAWDFVEYVKNNHKESTLINYSYPERNYCPKSNINKYKQGSYFL